MLLADDWKDYEIIDASDGEKLERWGNYILRRPEPQAIWPRSRNDAVWEKADAYYQPGKSGKGVWKFKNSVPEQWIISYRELKFYVEPTGAKQTGLFPEQAVNWNWLINKIKSASRPVKVLNLFAYTGGATVAAAYGGAEVCHVDAAKGMVNWAKENLALSGLGDRPVRFITDDVMKFVKREIRRGKQYDGIIMDPPSFGRGPKGEIWKIEETLCPLVETCIQVLSPNPLFFLINSYTTGFSPGIIKNILSIYLKGKFGGSILCGGLGIPITSSELVLPCGIFGRWEAES